jgi:hypothetical protein
VIGLIRRIFQSPQGRVEKARSEETDVLIHDLRNETQAVEAERYLLEKARMKRHWLEVGLMTKQALDREREQT